MLTQIKRNLELPFGRNMAHVQQYSSDAAEKAHLAATARALHLIRGFNTGPACIIQIHDSAAAPVEGAVCTGPQIPVQANSSFNEAFGDIGWAFEDGIYIVASSTAGTLTTIADANLYFNAQYS